MEKGVPNKKEAGNRTPQRAHPRHGAPGGVVGSRLCPFILALEKVDPIVARSVGRDGPLVRNLRWLSPRCSRSTGLPHPPAASSSGRQPSSGGV